MYYTVCLVICFWWICLPWVCTFCVILTHRHAGHLLSESPKNIKHNCLFTVTAYLSTHTVYWYKIQFLHYFGRIWPYIAKWIQGNIIFMRFCCCFKLSKKIEKQLNEQPTHAITKCTLAQCSRLRNLSESEIWSCACIFSTTLLLLSTATPASWNSKCRWHQQQEQQQQRAWPA